MIGIQATLLILTKAVRNRQARDHLLQHVAYELARTGQPQAAEWFCCQLILDDLASQNGTATSFLGRNRITPNQSAYELSAQIAAPKLKTWYLNLIEKLASPPERDFYTQNALNDDFDETESENRAYQTPDKILLTSIQEPKSDPIYPFLFSAVAMRASGRQMIRDKNSAAAIGWLSLGLATLDEEWEVAFGDCHEEIEAFAVALVELAALLSSQNKGSFFEPGIP